MIIKTKISLGEMPSNDLYKGKNCMQYMPASPIPKPTSNHADLMGEYMEGWLCSWID